jgi:beta-lactamase regulating signal transducer with metallopeptidase domain
MSALLSLVATNALSAGVLALAAWAAGRFVKRQTVVHGLWLLALVRLVAPPVLPVPILPALTTLLPAPPGPLAVAIRPRATTSASGAALREASTGLFPATDLASAPRGIALPVTASGSATAPVPRARGSSAPEPLGPGASAAPPQSPGADAAPFDAARALAAAALALGALGVVAVALHRGRRFRRLLACAVPAPPPVAARAREIARHLGLPNAPPVLLVPAPVPPMLWPTRRGPQLLLPQQLLGDLTADERDALLAHELAHVRRRDHWVRFVEIAATALFWWYPVAWWARTALRRAEERCCDEWVLRVLPSSAGAYASGLLKSLAFVSAEADPLPIGASGAGPVQDLEARLKEILMTRPLPRLAAPVRLAFAATAIAGLAVFPTHAQSVPAVALADANAPATVAASATAGSADTAPIVAAPMRVRRIGPSDVKPALVHPRAVGIGSPASADVAPGASAGAVAGGVIGGVPGGAVGGVPGGVVGGVVARGDLALATPEPDDPELTAERRALEEQRRKLREQEIDLERRTLDLDARADQKRLADDVARMRAEGRPAEAERTEKEVRLNSKRIELQKQQLQLELENNRLEAEMEKAAHDMEAGSGAGEAELEKAHQALEAKQQALEAEMEKASRQMEALEAEGRVDELRQSTGELEQSLAEHLESLRAALPEAGAQKADLEREIQRLQSALDALGSPSTGTKMRTPAPERMKMRQPAPPAPKP